MRENSLDVASRFQAAVQSFWSARERQQTKQIEGSKLDAGTRGAVTGGSQMGGLEVLIVDVLLDAGLKEVEVKTKLGLELPGYYRAEKKWDLIVVSRGQLVCALEFKSQVGPSFGNNINNRTEEALGSAVDVWTAYREGRLGTASRPFLGYFFLLEDCAKIHRPIKVKQPHFSVDPVFLHASYAKRYEVLCRRLVLERQYDAACLALATKASPSVISHPSVDLSFDRFVTDLRAAATRFVV